jgi:hypothetical protein
MRDDSVSPQPGARRTAIIQIDPDGPGTEGADVELDGLTTLWIGKPTNNSLSPDANSHLDAG